MLMFTKAICWVYPSYVPELFREYIGIHWNPLESILERSPEVPACLERPDGWLHGGASCGGTLRGGLPRAAIAARHLGEEPGGHEAGAGAGGGEGWKVAAAEVEGAERSRNTGNKMNE